MSSANNLCNQFGSRPGLTKTLLKKIILKKSADNSSMKNYPECIEFQNMQTYCH